VDNHGYFSMFGGEILGNTANFGEGVLYAPDGLGRPGGVISGNTASNVGNKVCIDMGSDRYIDGGDDGLSDGNTETPDGDEGLSDGNNCVNNGDNGPAGESAFSFRERRFCVWVLYL
jgi:hypothetical protein